MLERLPIEEETALALEEAEHLLRQLTLLTERERITWLCTDYDSPELMPDIQTGKREAAYLVHSARAEGEYSGFEYETEITEYLTIPGGKGIVTVELRAMRDGKLTASRVWNTFAEEAQVRFADAVLTRLADSKVVARGFDHARYSTDNIPNYIAAHPLTALGGALFRERRFLDYHRIVTDTAFREKLLSE